MAEEATQTLISTEAGAAEAAETADSVVVVNDDETGTKTVPIDELQHWSRNEAFGFNDDTIGWLENKGLENPQATLDAHRELEKKLGAPAEMLQKWPESDDKEGFDTIYHRLGTPKDVEGYKIEFEEGASVDPDTLEWFKKIGFEHNLTNEMLQGVALDWNSEVARLQEEEQQAIDVRNQTEETELRNSWGTKYDERIDFGERALKALGLSDDNIDSLQGSLGIKMVAEFAAKIADTMGEDTIAQHTDTTAFGTTKQQVMTLIDALNSELGADKKRFDIYRADHSAPKESTGKDYRRMQQLEAQYEGLVKAEKR